MKPTDLLAQLATELQEELQQRIEQIEFQADYPVRLEQCVHLVETLRTELASQQNITCLRVELDGGTEFVLTTDMECARQHLADIHAVVLVEECITAIVEQQYGGVAALTYLG